ncbi:MBL fold metallo-hydrolase [Acidihalobacter yilgarnensis]|uniref:MBL fold metallo-hydrolase n=1 Tax=Acidihalobacter yilgarnensis TaxID=2819280 RepID=A0A1D8IRM3_9GAMM|nr:N-acyl homoserine lactonase family protein [Acidihalobacter yilgarnensis]AOU99129.1 MBL fold metallo-hydrolase [Acidihalobacter yilgarnensis]
MTQATRLIPLLTGIHRYEKTLSTRHRGHGEFIEAPILAYLIETAQGRILYDVGCDYAKLSEPALRARHYDDAAFPFGPPVMREEDRLPNRLARLGLAPEDIDLVFVGHLHFDHAGGLCEVCGAEIHVHRREWEAARAQADEAYFQDDFAGDYRWRYAEGEYELVPGVRAIESPGHTAGHMSLYVELPKGAPIILAGDAADLTENLEQEIAPGLCWQEREDMALASIRKLKRTARETGAVLWPNHDMAFWRSRKPFPAFYE